MMYSPKEIETIRESGRLLATVLREVVAMVKPGVMTSDLDTYAAKRIRELGGEPSFLGYKGSFAEIGFPTTLCVSINDELVHAPATPSRVLKEGDIVGIDIGHRYPAKGGFCTDMAETVAVGKISAEATRLLRITQESRQLGIEAAKPGATIRDISQAVQTYVEKAGFSIVRDLIGHGVGKNVHEEPSVPNFVTKGPIGDFVLKPGLVIAIEPMVNIGKREVATGDDGWTVRTKDRSLAAHFEHTIAITESGPEILTAIANSL